MSKPDMHWLILGQSPWIVPVEVTAVYGTLGTAHARVPKALRSSYSPWSTGAPRRVIRPGINWLT